ncbi:MAG: GNAT family N-acetyltransferase, partial [Bacillota bacterium]|nr:GNAT family N-acetyltransferase [Bacillota bacterium]
AADLYAYASTASVGPAAGWAPHQTIEESEKIIRHFIAEDDVWAIEERVSGCVIGSVGLHLRAKLAGEPVVELGYVLSPDWEGRGLMTEACKAVLAHAFLDRNCEEVYVAHFDGNDKSRRVIQKLGFLAQDEIMYQTASYGEQRSIRYRMTRLDYIENGRNANMVKWNLDRLYKGFSDPSFAEDLKRLDLAVTRVNALTPSLHGYATAEQTIAGYLEASVALATVADRLFAFASLTESVETTNQEAVKHLNALRLKITETTGTDTLFRKWLGGIPAFEKVLENGSPIIKEHAFMLREIIQNGKYDLDEKTEMLVAKLRQSGSNAWDRLQSLLTANVAVDYEGSPITLSQVRNLAYDKDPDVRRKAYLAELDCYRKIETPVAFALNGIKGEVNTLCEERGYASPLDQALIQSRMSRATLDAMLLAMNEALPVFRKYLRRKGELLGHPHGLPFYDLFAPMGGITRTYTIPEANAYVLKNFKSFNDRLFQMADKAFKTGWIDYTPRPGKVGGAFCSNIHSIGESRVMTNFDGSFGDIITVSHELGHAYHGECIFGESILNSNYTMPVAETASTFCETIVNKAALREATSMDEKLFLLESSIQDYTQVIVDILSRFLFESAVFDGRKTTVFDENELKDMILDAQKKTYGDGLDPDLLHPYMWLCKSHYYSGTLSFYNFPYAFGLLFAKGLYARYLKDKPAFVAIYDDLLAATGRSTVEDAAKVAGIDVTDPAFWRQSLSLLGEDIELFLKLTE